MDGVLDPVEQEADSAAAADIQVAPESDATQIQDLSPQMELQATVVPSENIEVMYQKRIHGLEEELQTVLKNNQELTCQLNEMGHLVFPELSDCTELSLLERLKVYLKCQLVEKQDLERRAIQAEKAMLEMEQTVAVLQRHLQDAVNSSTQLVGTLEHHPPVSLPSPLPPLQTHTPVRFFFSKIHKKSAEKMMASCLRNQSDMPHGEANMPKQKTTKEAKIHQGVLPKPGAPAGEGLLYQVKEKPIEHEQKLPQTMSNLKAEESTRSHWYLPRSFADDRTHKRESSSDVCDVQVHRDGGSCLNMRVQDGTSILPETTRLSTRSKDYRGILNSPSVNPEAHAGSPVLEGLNAEDFHLLPEVMALPNGEGKHESTGGEVVKGKEKKSGANDNPMGFIDGTASQKLGASGAKSTKRWNVQVTHPVVGDPVGDDLLRSTRSLSVCFVHRGDNTVHLESGTSQSLSPKQAPYSNLGLLQKNPEDFSPLPILSVSPPAKAEEGSYLQGSASQGASVDLPSTPTTSLKIQTAAKKKMYLKGPSAVGKAKDELYVSTKDNPVVAVLFDSKTRELLPSSSGVAALASHCTESPWPILPTPANPDDLTEEGNLGLEIFL